MAQARLGCIFGTFQIPIKIVAVASAARQLSKTAGLESRIGLISAFSKADKTTQQTKLVGGGLSGPERGFWSLGIALGGICWVGWLNHIFRILCWFFSLSLFHLLSVPVPGVLVCALSGSRRAGPVSSASSLESR